MSQVIKYSCDILKGINKAGNLKRDSDGWFLDIILGGLDVFNSAGDFYPLATAKHYFESSSSLMRKAAKGTLFGEAGHPAFQHFMTKDDFICRLSQFPHDNVSHAIRNLRIQECTNPQTGQRYVAIIGDVLPVRKQGEYLEKELLTKDINVCFSLRSLTKDIPLPNGRFIKHITNLLGFDWVNEGGIEHAQKYNSISLESYNDFMFTREEAEIALAKVSGLGMESSESVDILESFNTRFIETPSGVIVPSKGW